MSSTDLSAEYLQVQSRVYANRLYQQDRWRILEWRENAVKAMSIVLGTAAFANVKGFFGATGEHVAAWMVLALVAMNVIGLVFQWGSKARDAAKRSAEWTARERDVETIGATAVDQTKLNAWRAKCADIEVGEAAVNDRLMWHSVERANMMLGVKVRDTLPQEAQKKAAKRWYAVWYALP